MILNDSYDLDDSDDSEDSDDSDDSDHIDHIDLQENPYGRRDPHPDTPEECYGIWSFEEAVRGRCLRRTRGPPEFDAPFPRAPPNMSLNIFTKRGSRRELYAAAIFGMVVQVAVVALAGLETYTYPWNLRFKKNGHPVGVYAFPLMVTGTSLLALGMIMCSHIIEASSTEEEWRSFRSKPVWMQKGETINDQTFDSFAFFGEQGHLLRKSSRDIKHNRESQVLIATFISIIGFIVQFSALRFLHWSITVCQLTAIAIMTALRAILRRNLADEPKAERMPEGFELDWMSKRLNACGSWKLIPMKEIPSLLEQPNSSLATAVVNSRKRLRTISNWAGVHQKHSESLTAAIGELMNFAFTSNTLLREPVMWSSRIEFEWAVAAEVTSLKRRPATPATTAENVWLKVKRRRVDDSRWSLWRAESNEIDAIFGLWALHFDQILKGERNIGVETSRIANIDDDLSLWLLSGSNYFTCSNKELEEWKGGLLFFDTLAEPSHSLNELLVQEICAQSIFSTFLLQIAPHWSPLHDITVQYGSKRKLGSFRLLSQTVTNVVKILENSELATLVNAYASVILALQICQALPKSTDPATLLMLLQGIKQREDGGSRDEADDVALWLSHQVEMASKIYRANSNWEDAGSVYWNYYAACKEVYAASPRTEDAARRMRRFEAIAGDSRETALLKSKKWKDVTSPWNVVIEEDVLRLARLLEENNSGIDARDLAARLL